eukprot:352751-Chlamydomonas_euryale.AAC.2
MLNTATNLHLPTRTTQIYAAVLRTCSRLATATAARRAECALMFWTVVDTLLPKGDVPILSQVESSEDLELESRVHCSNNGQRDAAFIRRVCSKNIVENTVVSLPSKHEKDGQPAKAMVGRVVDLHKLLHGHAPPAPLCGAGSKSAQTPGFTHFWLRKSRASSCKSWVQEQCLIVSRLTGGLAWSCRQYMRRSVG